MFFASYGFEVTGPEVSGAGLEKAERLAAERGVTIRWVCRSMLDLPVTGRFDLIYSCGSIHHVPKEDRHHLFRRLKTLTRPSGLHAHVVFTDTIVYPEKGEELDYFFPGELGRVYSAWQPLRYENGRISCCQDDVPHSHSVERIVTTRLPSLGSQAADLPSQLA